MKKARSYLILLLLAMQLVSCDKTDDGSYVKPITIDEKITGTWNLSSVKMVDEIAKSKGAAITDAALTGKFGFDTFQIKLNVDENSQPTTFEVLGAAPALFLAKGYWALSSDFPNTDGSSVAIELYADASKSKISDKLYITSIPGAKNTMEFKLVRTTGGVPYVSYVYQLEPAAK